MITGVWGHYNPVTIRFGRGCRSEVSALLAGQHCLIVTSPRGRRQLEGDTLLSKAITNTTSHVWMDTVEPNPDLSAVQDCIDRLAEAEVDCVLAFGGGSTIDSAKALALALAPAASSQTLSELIGTAASFPKGVSLPLYALPTTAGTGSEVTPYATIWNHAERRKLSLAASSIYPHTAYVDPELTDTLPLNSTIYTGLDAINQAAESIWNRGMTPLSEALAQRALVLGFDALPRLLENPSDPALRDAMAEASLLAGLAISQTRTSLCHAISYPLTAHFGIPHGLACAFTMSAVLRHNLSVDDGRFRRLAVVLDPDGASDTEGLLRRFDTLNQQLNVANEVRGVVISEDILFKLRDEMFTPGRADNTIAKVDHEAVQEILEQAWHS